jgi:uncharacterized protein (TIGR00156 family)
MKKPMLALLAFGLFTTAAMAQFTGPNANAAPVTVAAAGEARLGSNITLEGNIIERQRDDYYTFRDATGDIRVEIERDVWKGRQVGPEQKVRITGEVERGWRGRYIDVDVLDLV